MEESIAKILDSLDVTEMEKLLELDKDIKMEMDYKSLNRIKDSVYQKAGIKRQKSVFIPKKLIAVAASFIIVISSLFAIGFDKIFAAINQIFSFIPGYGIIENNDSVMYILSERDKAENDEAILTLSNVVAGRNNITVMVTLERKNYTEEQILFDKQVESERLQGGLFPASPKVNLYVDDIQYTEYSSATSGSGWVDTSSFTYTLDAKDIHTDMTYRLEYEDYGLWLKFKLKDYDSYSALGDIGPTECKNDISITVVPIFKGDDKVEVNLYPINKSGYAIDSFFKYDSGYLGNDLHIETNSGIKAYTPPNSYGSAHETFVFDIDPDDQVFHLKIPFIMIQSTEEKNITLEIPKSGGSVTVDHEIDFQDCTVTITELQRTSSHIGDNGELKMTFKYDNKSSNKTMIRSNIFRTNFLGGIDGGGYASEEDENGITTTVYFALEKGEDSTVRLKFANPIYYLTDEYTLTFIR